MNFSVGIIGFPNAGKSTLFKALTKLDVRIEPRPFTTIQPNVGIVPIPDSRLDKLSEIVNPEKTTPTAIEFWDIAGLIKNAHKGEGLGSTFLSQIRNCDILVQVSREFNNESISHTEGSVDPVRDREIMDTELLMKDLETTTGFLDRVKYNDLPEKVSLIKKVHESLEKGNPVRSLDLSSEESKMTKEFSFLTQKHIIYLINGEGDEWELQVNLKLEEEIDQLSRDELEELGLVSKLSELITMCYSKLDLITFYTVGPKEVRAWSIPDGSTAPRAGNAVHSDFEDKFIRADVISYDKFIETGDWTKAKDLGEIRTVGRDYIVNDGNIIEFKI